jgi:polyisoprenyl-teichoic acid--peptidoglycan teichoic acid transferase
MTEGARQPGSAGPGSEAAATGGRAAVGASASPGRAAVLSFILPGLGQLALGAVRSGLVLAIPIVVTVAVAAFFLIADRADLVSGLFDPSIILALVVLDGVLGLLHLLAVGDAYRLARRRLASGGWSIHGSPRLLVVLMAGTLLIHGTVGAAGLYAYDALTQVFQAPPTGYTIPTFQPTDGPTPLPGQTEFQVSPFPGPAWAADGQLNILLIGNDGGPGRTLLRTDTMIVLSVNVATGKAAMFGIPRNLINVPLAAEDSKAAKQWSGGLYPDLLNSLYVYAYQHPDLFPGATPDVKGFRALTGAIQQLLQVPLDGVVSVNLNGFVDMVDALGGVWINVPYPIYDDRYPLEDGSGYTVVNLHAGCQHFDGHLALEFARSRHQSSDYQRMDRQQMTLESISRQVDPVALLPRVPQLLKIAKDNFWSTFQPSDIGRLARFAATIDTKHIQNILFIPPTYQEVLGKTEIRAIQKDVQKTLAQLAVPAPTPGPSATPGASPKPTPTPKTCPPGGG